MDIIQQTDRRLVLRESGVNLLSIAFGLLFAGVPFCILLVFLSDTGVESLRCQRGGDRIDCTFEQSTGFGFLKQSPQPIVQVDRAEYRETTLPADSDCDAVYQHEFRLVSGSESQQFFIENMQVNCQIGSCRWIEQNVDRFNRFVASDADSFAIELDSRFRSVTLFAILFASAFIVCGLNVALPAALDLKLEFDKDRRELYVRRTTLLGQQDSRYELDAIEQVRYITDTDGDGDPVYSVTLTFHDLQDALPILKLDDARVVRSLGETVAEFLEVEFFKTDASDPLHSAKVSDQTRELARELLDYHQALYSQRHEFVRVTIDAKTFPQVDRRFYDRAQTALEAESFRKLADIGDVTIARADAGKNRMPIRVMLGGNGQIVGGIYAIPTSGVVKLLQTFGLFPKVKAIELESGFEGDTFLVTNNLKGLDNSAGIEGVERQQYASDTPIERLVAAHRETLARHARDRTAIVMHDYEGAIALQHRMAEVKEARNRVFETGSIEKRPNGKNPVSKEID